MGPPRPVVLPGITRESLLVPTCSSSFTPSSSSSLDSWTRNNDGVRQQGETGAGTRPLMALNTTSSETLSEMLRHLKRSYWPLPWDTNVDAYEAGGVGSHGGFLAAAKAAVGDEMSAQVPLA